MKKLNLDRFIRVSSRITDLSRTAEGLGKGNLAAADSKYISEQLRLVAGEFESVELPLSVLLIGKICNYLDNATMSHEQIKSKFDELIQRMADEAQLTECLIIPRDRAKYYGDDPQFGLVVNDKFPSAIRDISEAGKCLACGRGTATVFHLMRVMEAGLKAVANVLGIPYAPSWESYLSQIESRIAVKHKQKGIKWKRDEPFFREVAAHLQTVKLAWRNPTMHIVKHYDRDEALDVFNAVSAFMRHLATRLQETKKA